MAELALSINDAGNHWKERKEATKKQNALSNQD